LVAGVQALEDDEDALEVLRINPDAIVPHGNDPVRRWGQAATWISNGRALRNLSALLNKF
jgi:hypothetical protein